VRKTTFFPTVLLAQTSLKSHLGMEHWQREISGWIEIAKRQIHLALAQPSLTTSIVKGIFDRKNSLYIQREIPVQGPEKNI